MTRTHYRKPRFAAAAGRNTMAKAVSAAVFASAISTPAFSQTLEEVIVTATKRSESVQDVPLAITALSGEFMEDVNLTDVKDLVTYTPGVTGNSQDSFIDAISIRGIRTQDFGVGLDPSSAFFKNDLYEGRNGSAVTSLYDLDRAEVLRGPQGFLFGRNSIGGAFSVHTRRAEIDSSDGFVNLDLGERERAAVDAAINVPVGDNFAMRFAGMYTQEDGFVENNFPSDDLIEHENKAIRWSTTYENDRLGVYTMVEYEEREQSGSVYRAVTEGEVWETLEAALGPINVRGSDEEVDVDRSGGDNDDSEILTLGLRVDYDFDFATLTSNTGYKDHDYYYNEDYDGTPLNLETYRQDQEGDYFQQELRLTSNSEGPLSWYAGASYYKEDLETAYRFAGEEDFFCQYYGYYYNSGMTFSGCEDLYAYYGSEFTPSANGLLEETATIKGKYEGWGAYLNLAYFLTENLQIEGGLRWTDDEKEFTTYVPNPESELGAYWAFGYSTAEPLTAKESWDDVTPRFIIKYTPSDTALLYASYTAGYKSGGFGTFSLADNADGDIALGKTDLTTADGHLPDPVNPEEVDSFEVGYKDTFLDGSMNFDVVAFYYDYTDFQVTVGTDSGATLIENAGEVEAWGVESSLTAGIGDYLTAYATIGYFDSEATKLEDVCGLEDPLGCEGTHLFWAPEWSGSFVLHGAFPMGSGAITGAFELTFESERGGGWEELDETMIDSYEEMSVRVGWESDNNWFVEAYVENITDEFTWDGMNNLGGKEPHAFFGPRRPRTAGVRLGMAWD
ncbi:TonB-dependent receptor [Halioglobus maricola]|nr:TonB-dependent receptor [Halioglobus maricola]